MAGENQHAAIVAKKDTTNMIARKWLKIGSSSKNSEYLLIRTAMFHALGGMEPTPILGGNGTNIVKEPILHNKNARRKRLLPPPVCPPLVSVASVEIVTIPVGTAQIWIRSLRTAMRLTSSGEQPHIRSLCRHTASP
jgi:hypothetical protein